MTHPSRTLTAAEEMRLCLGFIVQPFVAGVVAFVAFPLLILGRAGDGIDDPGRAAISVGLGTFMFATGVTLVVVAPTAIWVVKRQVLTFKRALLFGFAIGNLPVVIGGVIAALQRILLSSSRPAEPWGAVGPAVLGSLIGVTGAAVFWAISIRGRDFSRDPD
jgi:hypothetical protein